MTYSSAYVPQGGEGSKRQSLYPRPLGEYGNKFKLTPPLSSWGDWSKFILTPPLAPLGERGFYDHQRTSDLGHQALPSSF